MPDRFTLIERLGRGGMGVVWKATDRESGQTVAIKLLHAHFAEEKDYLARFEREVDVARRIDSPHVVKVLGYGKQDGIPYIAMEYVPGESLRDIIDRRKKLEWEETEDILRQIYSALAAAHAAGVIHRDVKPSNILVEPNGNVKLVDFGIARATDLTGLTGSSTMLGTPYYMSPEGDSTPEGDLYSLGCVGYEMLTGSPPFHGDSMQQIIIRHIREKPDLSSMPAPAQSLLGMLLSKLPPERAQAIPSLSLPPPVALAPTITVSAPERRLELRERAILHLDGDITALDISPVEPLLAVCTNTGRFHVRRLNSSILPLNDVDLRPGCNSIRFARDIGGRLALSFKDGAMEIRELVSARNALISGRGKVLERIAAGNFAFLRPDGSVGFLEMRDWGWETDGYHAGIVGARCARAASAGDGTSLCIGEATGDVGLIDKTPALVQRIRGATRYPVIDVAFFNASTIRWLSGSTVWQCRIPDGNPHGIARVFGTPTIAAFSPRAEFLAEASAAQVVITTIEKGERSTYATGFEPTTLAWSADGKMLAVGCREGKVVILDVVVSGPHG